MDSFDLNLNHFCDPERNHYKDAHLFAPNDSQVFDRPEWPRHEMCSGEDVIRNKFELGGMRWEAVPCECECHKK